MFDKHGNQVIHDGDCFYHFHGDNFYFSFDGYELKQFEKAIADYNKKHFFSDEFKNCVINEYKENLKTGLDLLKEHKNGFWYYWYKQINVAYGSQILKPHSMEYIESMLNSSSS